MRGERVRITVTKVTRLTGSQWGNPKKVLHSDTGQRYATATDAMCAYGVSDHWRDQPVILTLDPRGQVIDVQETVPTVGKPRFDHTVHPDGQVTSEVRGWTVTYPATCNGRLADLGFVAGPYGGSDFVHFDADGQPYGTPMPKDVARRVARMRHHFPLRREAV